MTPQQQAALEGVVGRAITPQEVEQVEPLLDPDNRNDTEIARLCTLMRGERFAELRVTELGIRDLPVLPRHRHALLQVLRDAQAAPPSWLAAALEAAAVPVEDRPGLTDDLRAAAQWIGPGAPGISVGAAGTRAMLKIIAQAVEAAAPACHALLDLAPRLPVPTSAVSHALNVAEGRMQL